MLKNFLNWISLNWYSIVNYEIVITSNRYYYRFDSEFFDPNMLREYLIYFPKEKKYIAPNRLEYRIGEAPFD